MEGNCYKCGKLTDHCYYPKMGWVCNLCDQHFSDPKPKGEHSSNLTIECGYCGTVNDLDEPFEHIKCRSKYNLRLR